jgi:hypothetical protein
LTSLSNSIPGIGDIGKPYGNNLDSMDIIGKKVKKVGRTTGLQYGVIVAFGYGLSEQSQLLDRYIGKKPASLYTDLLIAPVNKDEAFSDRGDSGSLIVIDGDDDNNRPVTLLWGGQRVNIGRSFGIDLQRILKKMECEPL